MKVKVKASEGAFMSKTTVANPNGFFSPQGRETFPLENTPHGSNTQ